MCEKRTDTCSLCELKIGKRGKLRYPIGRKIVEPEREWIIESVVVGGQEWFVLAPDREMLALVKRRMMNQGEHNHE